MSLFHPLPLAPGHAALWYEQSAHPGSSHCQAAELIEIIGPVDCGELADTVRRCAAHPSLAVRFQQASDGTPVRLPDPHARPSVRVVSPEEFHPEDPARHVAVPAMRRPGELRGEELQGHLITRTREDRVLWLARFHHILGDGFSFQAFVKWVADCYSARLAGRPEPSCPLVEPTGAGKPLSEEDAAYWREAQIPENPPGLISGKNPPEATVLTRRASVTLSAEERRALTGRARDLKATELELLITAVAHYLGSITGEASVSVGLPLMNRIPGRPAEFCPTVTVAPMALAGARPDLDTTGALALTSHQLAGARRHGHVRPEELRRLRGIADPGRHLTTVDVNYRPFSPTYRFGDAVASLSTLAVGPVADVELIFQSAQRRPGASAQDLELLALAHGDAQVGEALARHVSRIMRLVAALARGEELGQARYLNAAEEQQVLEHVNRTDRNLQLPGPATVQDALLRRRKRECADARLAEAARAGGDQGLGEVTGDAQRPRRGGLWWADAAGNHEVGRAALWHAVDTVASHLVNRGLGPGSLVAVCLRRTPALPLCVAGILVSGAAVLPIDPDLPVERRHYMLEAASPELILTDQDASGHAMDAVPVAWRESGELAIAGTTGASGGTSWVRRLRRASAEDLAYVLFTSGSTGRPKAVAVEHRSLVNRLAWMVADYELTCADTVMQKTPCSFDVSLWELVLAFTHGLRLAVASDGAHRDVARICRELAASRTTVCHFVPSMLDAVLADPERTRPLTHLRMLFASGEALPAELARKAQRAWGCRVVNLYGPTEAAIDVTAQEYRGEAELPIGAPVWNTRAYVLDAWHRPVPVGCPGTLWLAGVQLARGYLGQPELTAQRFLPCPFGNDEAYPRMYDTGDVASWREDGVLLFHGRKDGQVKLRGQRLELGEVAAVLRGRDGVAQAVAVLRPVAGEPAVVGYVVPRAGRQLDPAALRAEAAEFLPAYMVPSACVVLSQLPTTVNGKLDQRALPEPELGGGDTTPRSSREERVQRAFAFVLRREPGTVPLTTSFFDLGGHSLKAVELAKAVSEEEARAGGRGIGGTRERPELGIADIFAAPSVRQLARRLEATSDEPATTGYQRLLTLRPHAPDCPLPPIFACYPAGGLGWSYAGLLPLLSPGRGLYALQAPGLLEEADRAQSVEHAAASAAADIRAVVARCAVSEVVLLGWSVGGVVAQALAARAEQELPGVQIRSLVLLDAYPAELWRGLPEPSRQEVLRGILFMAGRAAPEGVQLTEDSVVELLRASEGVFSSLPRRVVAAVTTLIPHNAALMRAHRTAACPHDAHLFQATRNPDHLDPMAWAPYVRGLRVHPLDVDHPGLMRRSSLQQVAEVLGEKAE